MADGQYKFSIGLDDKQLEMDIAQAKKAFDSLVRQAQQAGAKIDNMPNPFENIARSAPQVQQATQQFNGLNVATQQLVRELPAASMGLNTFFLAISNNLPIFADQVKNLRQQGTSVSGVLKGIGSALFSWQTALVLGITALSMYGKEIGNWISSLFKGKNAVDSVKEATEGLNASIEKNGLGIGKELGKYESLRREFEAINGDLKEQERFVRDNQSAFDDLGVSVNSVVDAEAFFSGEGTEAFLTALRLRAEALAAQKLAVEQYEKAIIAETNKANAEIELQSIPQYTTQNKATSGGAYAPMSYGGSRLINSDYTSKKEEIDNLDAEAKSARSVADAYFDMYDAKMKAAGDTLEGANIKQSDEQAQAQIRAAELRAKQIAEASARLKADAERATSQAEVDAMAEGIQKKIAQINLNYDIEEQAITKREEELKKLRGGMLTSGEQKAIDAMRKANASERDRSTQAAYNALFAEADAWLKKNNSEVEEMGEVLNKELARRTKAWEDYFLKYGTIKERLLAVTTKYNRLINDAETEAERMSLEAERDAILAQYEVEASAWAKELVGKTSEQLNTMIEELQAQVDAKQAVFDALDSSDSDDAKKYREEINKLNAQIKVLQQQLGKAKKDIGDDNWTDATQVFQNISQAANDAAEGIAEFDEGAASVLRTMAQLAGTAINLIGAIQAVSKTATAAAGTIKAMEKASAILAVVGAAIQAVSVLIDLFKGSDEVEQTMRQFKELNQELERLHKLARIDNLEGTIFGDNPYGNFANNLLEMRAAAEAYKDAQQAIIDSEKHAKNWDPGIAKILEPLGITIEQIKDGTAVLESAIAQMYVRLSKSEFGRLGELAPEIFVDGEVTLEGLKKLKESALWDDLLEKDRDLITALITNWEYYNEAIEASNRYLSDIFGELGYTMTNALVDAFENGTDAAQAFGEAASDVIEKLATDMIHAALVQPILDKYQLLVDEANLEKMSPEERIAELTRLIGEMSQEVLAVKGEVDATAAQVRQDAEDVGITGVYGGSSSSSATSKGFQTMSQETGSELNGRFTDIQGQAHIIAEAVEFNKEVQQQQTLYLQSVSETLAAIKTDTDSIEKHTRALANIESDISAMRRTMDNGGGL
jgi:ABC-type transporter Mla subunit MlaD